MLLTFKDQIYNFCYNNLTVIREDGNEYAALCPFHQNFDTPALYINKSTGLWHCFNEGCGAKGRFPDLVFRVTGIKINEGLEDLGLKFKNLTKLINDEEKIVEDGFDEAMDRITLNYRDESEIEKLRYLIDRGFKPAILEHFEVGYSSLQDRIVIPVRDENFKIVGFIGRALDEEKKPKYKYTNGFQRKNILLNLHNAKNYDHCIVVEGSLDHIKIHQAGFPNVISTMGSTISDHQIELMTHYFNGLTLFADNDEAGQKMRQNILDRCAKMDLYVVNYIDGIKDPGDMTETQIQNALENKITYIEFMFNQL